MDDGGGDEWGDANAYACNDDRVGECDAAEGCCAGVGEGDSCECGAYGAEGGRLTQPYTLHDLYSRSAGLA